MQISTNAVYKNYFFIALCLFAISLPLSQAFVSIGAGLLFLTALIEDNIQNKLQRVKRYRILFLLSGIYFIYIISAITSSNFSSSLYDLRKALFYLLIPISFVIGRPITKNQFNILLKLFIISVCISILIGIFKWFFVSNNKIFSIHEVTFVDHIQFSFQLILSFWASLYIYKVDQSRCRYFFIITALISIIFLLLQQSLIGLLSFIATLFYITIYGISKTKSKYKSILFLLPILVAILPVAYLYLAVDKFYDIENVDLTKIETKTTLGNPYHHNFNNKQLENGNYVYLYISEDELRDAWNKRSSIKYDSVGSNNYIIKSTLIRYMTSKGLRKDAQGVSQLNESDIENIENGIANVIFTKSKYSIYPRTYQTIWEYDTFIKTGNSNNKSFAQRLVFWQAAVHIIKNHPYFGVGTCCWKDAFYNYYHEFHPELDSKFYASSHNQYLNYLIKFGIIGFIMIMVFIFIPILKLKLYVNPLFMIFFLSLMIGNFGDSNFETHMAGAFFVFFFSMFIKMKLSEIILNLKYS